MEVLLSGSIDNEGGGCGSVWVCGNELSHGVWARNSSIERCRRRQSQPVRGRASVTARTPPLRGYVGQRRPHKLIIAAQINHTASQWIAPHEFDPMSHG